MNNKTRERSDTRNSIRNSIFERDDPEKNLKIPTLKQINNDLNKTFIGSRLDQVQEELKNLENNEVTQIINILPQTKLENNKFSRLTKKSISHIFLVK